MTRILYVTTISGTINAFLVPHILALLDEGHTVDCAASSTVELNQELVARDCKFNNIPFARSLFSLENISSFKKIRTLIIKGKYDIVHVHTPIASAITRLACIGLKVKVIYTAHGFHFYKGSPKKNWLIFYPIEKLLSYFTDTIICINKEDYLLSSTKFRKTKTVYIPGIGINTKRFMEVKVNEKKTLKLRLGFHGDEFVVISIGELNNNKNQIMLLKAMDKLSAEGVRIKLLLVGEGINRDKYEKYIREMGLETNVFLLGKRTDVPELLQSSDLLVSTSFREGLPVNVMEGMASGLPVIVTDIRGSRDLIKSEENGLIIKHDVSELSNSILKMLNNDELREKIGKNNNVKAQSFEINKIIGKILNVYKS